jgi:membrane associated rhomboid family serine protease
MGLNETEILIGSRFGRLRDLVPIYSFRQALLNLVVILLIIWFTYPLEHLPFWLLPIIMIGWVLQFVDRPSTMTVSQVQADWLEQILQEQGHFTRSDFDGRWRPRGAKWWQSLPHLFIEFVPGDTVTVNAPRYSLESLRATVEQLIEYPEPVGHVDHLLSAEPVKDEKLRWHAQVPTYVLATSCVVTWFWHVVTHGLEGMSDWGVSVAALGERRLETIFLHMFAHGGSMHLVMNMTMLVAIGGVITSRLGRAPFSWLRFFILYTSSGLAGAALYLMMHPAGTVPMLGASGALYGLLGLLIRLPVDGEDLVSLKSRSIRRTSWNLIKENAFLFALLAVMAWVSGTAGGLAWEAHVGGFLFGLIVGPKMLPSALQDRSHSRVEPAHDLQTIEKRKNGDSAHEKR